MADVQQEERHVRPFVELIRDLRKGLTHDELSEVLADVVTAVEEHRKPGKVVFTIAIDPIPKSDALAIVDSIKATVPEPDRDATLMFADKGRLTRHNPRQLSIDDGLRVVDTETGEINDKQEDAS
ncbi:MAG: hypothetical protein KY469_10620 [Actinobacteria bacterium]|nr:hypothetical protein [Actinomycetota bacterium]